MKPTVLTLAGSDCSGGAGLQADVRTLAAHGVHPMTVVTAVTVQSAAGVRGWTPIPAATVAEQLQAVFEDAVPRAIKSGMLGDAGNVSALAERLTAQPSIPYVCDPLVRSGTGVPLIADEALRLLRAELLPRATVLTPNVDELGLLADRGTPGDEEALLAAATELLARGARAVLIKGGHRKRRGVDTLVTPDGRHEFAGEIVSCGRVHGAGCVLSAAIAGRLARGDGLIEAVGGARAFVGRAIAAGGSLGGVRFPDPQSAAATRERR